MAGATPTVTVASVIRAATRPSAFTSATGRSRSSAACSRLGRAGVHDDVERAFTIAWSAHIKDPRNAERTFPYLGGQEINTSPSQSHDRYAINFGQLTLEHAERWPDLLAIVCEKVKPERDKLREDTGPGKHGKKYWWQYQHSRQPLYEAITPLDRCLVNS